MLSTDRTAQAASCELSSGASDRICFGSALTLCSVCSAYHHCLYSIPPLHCGMCMYISRRSRCVRFESLARMFLFLFLFICCCSVNMWTVFWLFFRVLCCFHSFRKHTPFRIFRVAVCSPYTCTCTCTSTSNSLFSLQFLLLYIRMDLNECSI